MSVSKSTKWSNHSINSTVSHKKYIISKAEKQYWFNMQPKNFTQNWNKLLHSSINYERSKRKDYRFVFSLKKEFVKDKNKFFALCIQFQKNAFKNYAGLFAIHQNNSNYHAHFLLNPIDISAGDRKFHQISPADFQNIKENWENYLRIFGMYDGYSNCQIKQRSWSKYYQDRNSGKNFASKKAKRYNLDFKEKFVDNYFNPFIEFLSYHSNISLKKIGKKKFKKNSNYSYYNTNDIIRKVNELKEIWIDIKWSLFERSISIETEKIINFFCDLLEFDKSAKISKLSYSYPALYNKVKNDGVDFLFAKSQQLKNEIEYIKDIVSINQNNSISR